MSQIGSTQIPTSGGASDLRPLTSDFRPLTADL